MNKLGQMVFVLAAAAGSMAIVACGGGGSGADASGGQDSGSGSGSQTQDTVTTVDCASGSAAATVTAPGFAYVSDPAGASSSDSAIKSGDIVKFDLTTAMNHPVGPDSAAGMTDPGIVAPTGAVTCLKFSATGTFHYECTVHGFKGTVTVTQ